MIQFRCPGSCRCGNPCTVADEHANCRVACPHSGEVVRVPARTFSEDDWLRSTDPQQMLYGLPFNVSDRKFRLFAFACCQRIESRLTHSLSRETLILAEKFTEGAVTDEEMETLSQRLRDEYNARLAAAGGSWSALDTTDLNAPYSLTSKVFPAGAAAEAVRAAANPAVERLIQCQLLR